MSKQMATEGRNSLQYKVVRKLSHKLTSGIQDGFVGIVGQAFEKGLITKESHDSLIDSRQPVLDRATQFVSVILEKIEQDVVVYDDFVGILRSEKAWHRLADKMDRELAESGVDKATVEATDGKGLAPPTSTAPTRSAADGTSSKFMDSQVQRREETAQEEDISGSVTKETLPALYVGTSTRSELIVGQSHHSHTQTLGQIKAHLDTAFEEKDMVISDLSREVTEGKEREKKLQNEVRLVQQQKEDMQRRLEISEEKNRKVVEEKEAAVKRYEREIEKLKQRISQMEEDNRQMVDDYKSQIIDLNKKIASLSQLKENAELQRCEEETKFLRKIMELKDELFKINKEENRLRIRVAEEQRRNAELRIRVAEEQQRNAELETKYAKEKQQQAEEKQLHAEEKQLHAEEKQLHAEEKQLHAEEQKQDAEERAELFRKESLKKTEEIQQLRLQLGLRSCSNPDGIEEVTEHMRQMRAGSH